VDESLKAPELLQPGVLHKKTDPEETLGIFLEKFLLRLLRQFLNEEPLDEAGFENTGP